MSIILRSPSQRRESGAGAVSPLWDPAIPTVCASFPSLFQHGFLFSVSCHGCPLCPPVTVSSLVSGLGALGFGQHLRSWDFASCSAPSSFPAAASTSLISSVLCGPDQAPPLMLGPTTAAAYLTQVFPTCHCSLWSPLPDTLTSRPGSFGHCLDMSFS